MTQKPAKIRPWRLYRSRSWRRPRWRGRARGCPQNERVPAHSRYCTPGLAGARRAPRRVGGRPGRPREPGAPASAGCADEACPGSTGGRSIRASLRTPRRSGRTCAAAPLGPADHETVTAERVELVHRRGILGADERVLPAALAVLVAVVHQEVALGELERLGVGVGDHRVPGERPLTRDPAGPPPAARPGSAPSCRGASGGALSGRAPTRRPARAALPDHQLAPAADPDRRVRPLDGLRLERASWSG